ncbi:DUF3515 family protein [Subtercola sp. RTI3]|uniref:DUF3515 family protein n=1 Tax=Subtercola sp. RTI3 TaxID=3048639 RepID=UPI002B230B6B|nr:DUF3515 family protein [Subtercola sp. RTI3]MEA9985525.1 DUF3515 family protein [Subtercola sp. RTI3]
MFTRKRLLVPGALLAGLLAVVVTGCTPTVALDPAANATDPGCAEVMVRLPDSVASESLRQTNAQATAAWGSPASILLRCGVQPYGPTTLPCDTISGIDWIEDDSQAPSYTFTTFGRTPATQVIVDSNAVSAVTALVDLQSAFAATPQTNKCVDANDVLGAGGTPIGSSTGTAAPTPAPTAGSTGTGTGTGTGTTTVPTPAPTDTTAPFIIETTPPAAAG